VGTNISWTTETWNPTIGCDKVSPGCDNCYAITQARIRAGNPNPKIRGAYQGVVDRGENGVDWTGKVNLLPDRLQQPFKWRKPRRVFVDSMSDLFHSDVPDGFIAQVWEVMAQTPQHTYQILTKRPGRMRSWVTRWHDNTGDDDVPAGPHGMPPMPRGPEAVRATYTSPRARLFADMLDSMGDPPEGAAYPLYDWMEGPRYYPGVLHNVHLGVSVENQEWAQVRLPALRETPAATRFVSAEPLLGPVDLTPWLDTIDWVICGGESGPGARPMHPEWARDLRDQCIGAGVAFHFKQWGEWSPRGYGIRCGVPRGREARFEDVRPAEHWLPGSVDDRFTHTVMARVGPKAAGRELDGRTWDEYPAGAR
jgi:protein gp37